ncbi:unnamed protein product [Discosporangium mesarthrocarpum]
MCRSLPLNKRYTMGGGKSAELTDVVGFKAGPFPVSYNQRDLILYALGIGCTRKSELGGDGELRFLYEEHEDFQAFPTYALVLPFKGSSGDVVSYPGPALCIVPPALQGAVDPTSVLHYDQSLTMLRPLDPDGATLESRSKVLGIYRKGRGALLRSQTTLLDKGGETVAVSIQGTYIRGLKVEEDVGPPLPPASPHPSEAPDLSIVVAVPTDMALLYRLSGDYNPLHADLDAAAALGMGDVILHGLCTLGLAVRQVCIHTCPTGPAMVRSVSARFTRPVFPGAKLQVDLWCRSLCGKKDKGVRHAERVREESGLGTNAQLWAAEEGGSHFSAGGLLEVFFKVARSSDGGQSITVIEDGRAVLCNNESCLETLQMTAGVTPVQHAPNARL